LIALGRTGAFVNGNKYGLAGANAGRI